MAELNWGALQPYQGGNALVAGIQAGQQQRAYNRKAALEERQIEGQQEVGNALARNDYDAASAAALKSGNPELFSAVQKASEAQRTKLKDQSEAIGRVAFSLKQLPPEQRGAALAAAAPSLKAHGITDEVLAGANLSDAGLDGYISSAMSIRDMLAQTNADRDFSFKVTDAKTRNALTLRGQERQAADAAAGRAVTMRGQDLSNAQAAANRAAQAEAAKPLAEKRAEEVADKRRAREGAAASFDVAIDSIKRLREHPAFSGSVGASIPIINGRLPGLGLVQDGSNAIPGTEAADFDSQLETLKAQTFLPQVQALKGAGALSDAEGSKLTAAVGALNSKMPEKRFRESLDRIEADLTRARDRALTASPNRTAGLPTKVANDAEYDRLASGTRFVGPDGKVRIKP